MIYSIVYVLISNVNDLYFEQALISIYSLKLKNPSAKVILLCDKDTQESLNINNRNEILKYLTEIKGISIPKDLTQKQKSRWLKTSMRKYIKGNFLFIDCDTIITDKLEDNIEVPSCISAVYDSHTTLYENAFRKDLIKRGLKININLEHEKEYFNSGVLYVKDTPEAYSFFELWHKNWIEGLSKGVDFDQPTLAKTNIQMNHIITKLNDCYNCQIYNGAAFLSNAKVIHYFGGSAKKNNPYAFTNNQYLLDIKKNGLTPNSITYKYIIHPKQAFIEPTIIIGKEDFTLLCTPLFYINRNIIKECPKAEFFLRIISIIIYKVIKLYHSICKR